MKVQKKREKKYAKKWNVIHAFCSRKPTPLKIHNEKTMIIHLQTSLPLGVPFPVCYTVHIHITLVSFSLSLSCVFSSCSTLVALFSSLAILPERNGKQQM